MHIPVNQLGFSSSLQPMDKLSTFLPKDTNRRCFNDVITQNTRL